MLLVLGDVARRLHALQHIAADTGLALRILRNAHAVAGALRGESRNVLVVGADDLDDALVQAVKPQAGRSCLAMIVVGEDADASGGRLADFSNLSTLGADWTARELAETVHRALSRMLEITAEDIDAAVAARELVVQYQPKVERGERRDEWRTTEAEAFIRWRHPRYGLIGPADFLPEAERSGRIDGLTELVLRNTLRQLKRWDERGLELGGCVNLTPPLLVDPGLPDVYAQIAGQYGLDAARITFELAEPRLDAGGSQWRAGVERLRAHGFRTALDNFGAASGSLRTLSELPFDEIKLHPSLLHDAERNRVTRQSIAAVTGLAHSLGLGVCAEGVEHERHYQFLEEIRCDKMQGYFVSEAVMPEIIRSCYSARVSPDGGEDGDPKVDTSVRLRRYASPETADEPARRPARSSVGV